jgi:hypothetical protein
MDESKILIEDNSATAFLAHIFVPILGLHMLSRENTLLELKIDAILTKHFREELAFYLLDEFVDGVAEGEIALIGWMRVEV